LLLSHAIMNKAAPLLLAAGIALASSPARAQPLATINLGAGTRPESVTRGFGGKYYVSLQNSGAAGTGVLDGEIRAIDPGTLAVTAFVAPGILENPRGITFTGSYLVVTDTTRVWKVDHDGNVTLLADGAAFPNPIAFLNDAAAEPDGRAVVVTEMGSRTIIRDPANANHLWPTDSPQAHAVPATSRAYRISMHDGEVTEVITPSRKVLIMNGLAFSRRTGRMIVGEFFYGNVVDIKKGRKHSKQRIVATPFRGADGIEQGRDGTIFVSSFEQGMVWKMDKNGENLQLLLDGMGFQSTADFYLDEGAHQLLLANTQAGTVIVLGTE
jgi:sugar lactone lactonase YvrE